MWRPRWLDGDTRFLVALGLLVELGLIFLSSASAPLAYERFGSRSYYLTHQILSGVLPGIVAFFVFARLRRAALHRIAVPLYVASVALLLLVFIPGLGVTYGRARNW